MIVDTTSGLSDCNPCIQPTSDAQQTLFGLPLMSSLPPVCPYVVPVVSQPTVWHPCVVLVVPQPASVPLCWFNLHHLYLTPGYTLKVPNPCVSLCVRLEASTYTGPSCQQEGGTSGVPQQSPQTLQVVKIVVQYTTPWTQEIRRKRAVTIPRSISTSIRVR